MSIAVGQTAPDFTLLNQEKKEVKLSDFAGKKNIVLVWYPLDWSPTCTNEHACFVNEMKRFETLDAEVLGVSVDSVWSHKAYAEKMGIKYSLLKSTACTWRTKALPAGPSRSSIRRARWPGSRTTTFRWCRI